MEEKYVFEVTQTDDTTQFVVGTSACDAILRWADYFQKLNHLDPHSWFRSIRKLGDREVIL